MTPQERQLIDDLFDRLAKLENTPRDPEALAAISAGLRKAPNAVYPLVQTVLLQDEALRRANERIEQLEAAAGQHQEQPGGFLDSMRDAIFGQGQSRGSVPPVPPPESRSRPVWNSGQTMQQQPQASGPYAQSYGQPYGGPQPPFGGGGGSFLGTAAAAAAGVVGGSLLLNSIRGMMGGPHQAFGDTSALGETGRSWSDASNSDLAREAGISDIGSAGGRDSDEGSRAGLFDQASNDDYNNDDNSDYDNDDGGFDDGGDDGGSDYA
jgi:uncharacterized protein